uniref:hypothetical protein n=1 Tax=uncultured Methanobrevibacter sp. TaxID=253161 RepID=UPI0026311D52
MNSKHLFIVLVLISILSIGAVSAVDDADIGTDVIEATDDLSIDTVSVDEIIEDSSQIDEN